MPRSPADVPPRLAAFLGLWLLLHPAGAAAASASDAPWEKTTGHPAWLAVARALREAAGSVAEAVPALEGPLAWEDPVRAAAFERQRERLSELGRRLAALREEVLALPVPERRGPRPPRLPLADSAGRPLCAVDRGALIRRWLAVDYAAPYRAVEGEPPLRRVARLLGWRELAGRYLDMLTEKASAATVTEPTRAAALRIRQLLEGTGRVLTWRDPKSPVPPSAIAAGSDRLLDRLRTATYDRLLAPFPARIAREQAAFASAPEPPTGGSPPPPAETAARIAAACHGFGGWRQRLQRLLEAPGLVGGSRRIAAFYMELVLPLEGLCAWATAERLPDREGTAVGDAEEAWARWHRRTWIGLRLEGMGWTLLDPLGIEENLRILESLLVARSAQAAATRTVEEAAPLSAPALVAWDTMLERRMAIVLGMVAEWAGWYARLAALPDMHPRLLGELRTRLADKLAVLARYVDARDDLRIYMTTPTEELLKRKLDRTPGIGEAVRERLAEDAKKGGDVAARALDRAVGLTLKALERSGVDPMVYLSPKRPPASPLQVLLDDVGEDELTGASDHFALRRYFLGRLRYRLSAGRGSDGFGCR